MHRFSQFVFMFILGKKAAFKMTAKFTMYSQTFVFFFTTKTFFPELAKKPCAQVFGRDDLSSSRCHFQLSIFMVKKS